MHASCRKTSSLFSGLLISATLAAFAVTSQAKKPQPSKKASAETANSAKARPDTPRASLRETTKLKSKKQKMAHRIPTVDSPILGAVDAPIDFVLFGDYQCEATRGLYPLVEEISKDPVLSKNIRVIFKHFPMASRPNARPAALAALAAQEQGKFWEMSSELFKEQKTFKRDSAAELAKALGLDVSLLREDAAKNKARYEKVIDADIALGETLGVRGTPSVFVGGWTLGDRTLEGVKALIKEKMLAKKQKR